MSEPQWCGYVTDVEGDIFTAVLRRDGHPDLLADFSMKECGLAGLKPYDDIIVTPDSVRQPDPIVWTQEQLDAIWVRARERAKIFRSCFE